MSRRREAKLRPVLPDPVYKDELITKFINCMMYDGKKSVAEKQFYGALEKIKAQGSDPLEVFKAAVKFGLFEVANKIKTFYSCSLVCIVQILLCYNIEHIFYEFYPRCVSVVIVTAHLLQLRTTVHNLA